MALSLFRRTLISKPSLTSIVSRAFTSASISGPRITLIPSSPLLRLRPLVALTEFCRFPSSVSLRCFATRQSASSLNDPNPNWSNRPPKETILLDGCDFEHWLVVMEKPEGEPTRDEIIDSYIKTLAMVVGSEGEARMKIYSVSTRHYYAFGALVSEELSYKIKELPRVRWVLPDSYLDVKNKDYGGEPFINGQAVPYDPKYHEEWVRNNARANERSRRNDRPRNFDRSRNFERRRENMQNRDFQAREMPPMPNRDPQSPMPNVGGMPPNQNFQNPLPNMGGMPTNQNFQNPMPNMGGMPKNQNFQNPMPNMGGMPPPVHNNNMPNMGGMPPNRDAQNPMPNMGGMPPVHNSMPNMGGMPNNAGYSNNMPNMGNMPPRDFQNRDGPHSGGMPYQNREMPSGAMPNRDFQNSNAPNRDMGGMPDGNPYPR
uniref:MORF/ORRM1/DAG-like MORF domain-containing protein n=1 Tax=Nelumbo nucifera TaxID=4432 RepID=A0A822XPR4_NELNU|nr:TPA_asm: hypothetical protein HUJ06_022644 [Nelumbo nucifera]